MKKIHLFILSVITILTCGCENVFRDEFQELHSEIDELRSMLVKTNSNVEALQVIVNALQENDYVTGVTPIIENGVQIGYTINFCKSGSITIYHGNDGHSPVIGVKQASNGDWYWTIDGSWYLDNDGHMVRASGKDGEKGDQGDKGDKGDQGITPLLKIEDGYWFISFNEGEDWDNLGKATGEDGDSMFREIRISDSEITFVTADGYEFSVPRNARVRIFLDVPEKETGVLPGSEIQINYTLENATDSTFVTASSNGYYGVRVEEYDNAHGRIIVTSPYKYVDGYINIMVSDGASYSFIKVVNFYEHKMEFPYGLEYHISNHDQEIHIPFSTNFQYRFEVEPDAAGWISLESYETKSEMRDGTLIVKVSMNDQEWARSGRIYVIPNNSAGDIYTEIIINQESAYLSIEQSKFAVPCEGGIYSTQIVSSRGLSIRTDSSISEWFSVTVENEGGDNYRIHTAIKENKGSEKRMARVELYSDDMNTYLGSLEFIQSSPVEEDIANMVFIVRANFSNDFTAYLPISGEYNCYIDWGDGQAEHAEGNTWENAGIKHEYRVYEPTTYKVTISGRVTKLTSENIPAPCIVEVVQWGKTDLNDLNSAFENNYLLQKVSDDIYNAFENVYNVDQMFYMCSELQSINEGIFQYCKNINNAYETFAKCLKLKEIPERLFANCSNLEYLDRTFWKCNSLTTIPENLFANNRLRTLSWTFHDCDNLKEIPENLFIHNSELESFDGTFDNCNRLETIPENLFASNLKIYTFSSTFCNCPVLQAIPEGLFRRNRDVRNFNSTFAGCYGIKEIPTGLFDNNRKVVYFDGTFSGLHEAKGESPYTVIDGIRYHLYERHLNPDHFVAPVEYNGCFGDCWQLSDYAEIERNRWIWN